MDWLKDQFARSNIISGLLALAIWGGIIYLAVGQVPIPDILYAGGMAVVGFFFGAKVGEENGKARILRVLDDGYNGKYRTGPPSAGTGR